MAYGTLSMLFRVATVTDTINNIYYQDQTIYFIVEEFMISLNSGRREAPPTRKPSMLGQLIRPVAVAPTHRLNEKS